MRLPFGVLVALRLFTCTKLRDERATYTDPATVTEISHRGFCSEATLMGFGFRYPRLSEKSAVASVFVA